MDNGWLAAALIMVRNTRPALRERADALLEPMDFRFFYEPYDPADPVKHPGLLHGVYWPDDESFGTLHGLVNTEPRIASYIGIARGQLPPEHYYRIYRTLAAGTRSARRSRCREASPGPTWASTSSSGTTPTGGCGSSRAGAAACSRR